MAVDKELIEKTMGKLGKKLDALRTEERELQKLINNLQLIRGIGDEQPKDPITDEPMSEERIKEIFNSVAKKGSKYIGGNK